MASALPPYYADAVRAGMATGWDPDVIYAQWILETGNFTSPNFRNNKNIAGQTWHSGLPTSMRGTARPRNEGGYYIKYTDPVQGYIDFIHNNSRYKNVKNYKTEYEQIQEIKRQGWAVDPNYVAKVFNLVQTNHKKYNLDTPINGVPKGYSVDQFNSPYKFPTNDKTIEGNPYSGGLSGNVGHLSDIKFDVVNAGAYSLFYELDEAMHLEKFSITNIDNNIKASAVRGVIIWIGLLVLLTGLAIIVVDVLV